MKILRKIAKFMDKYGMIKALVFNVCLVLILLEIRLFIKLYVIFRFTKRKYFKMLSKKKRRST